VRGFDEYVILLRHWLCAIWFRATAGSSGATCKSSIDRQSPCHLYSSPWRDSQQVKMARNRAPRAQIVPELQKSENKPTASDLRRSKGTNLSRRALRFRPYRRRRHPKSARCSSRGCLPRSPSRYRRLKSKKSRKKNLFFFGLLLRMDPSLRTPRKNLNEVKQKHETKRPPDFQKI
jgi:hypothetical protein